MTKTHFLGSLLAGASLLAVDAASPALAQLTELVVTARKREESLQSTPLTVSAFTSTALENARIQNVGDLAGFTPNMTFTAGESGRVNTPVFRGMGVIDTRGFDNNVGVFIDGIFVSGRASQNVAMLDLERVEVVKGPQSALYGRNSFAGAINYVTKRPSDEFEGKVEATLGTDELYEALGSVSGPIVEGKLFGRVALSYTDDAGTYDNSGPQVSGDTIGGRDGWAGSIALRLTPNDAIDINFDAYFADEEVDQVPIRPIDGNCGEFDPATVSPNSRLSFDEGVPYYFCGEFPDFGTGDVSLSPGTYAARSETSRFSLDVSWDLDGYTLQSISSYSDSKSIGYGDLDKAQFGADNYAYMSLADYEAAGSPLFLIPTLSPFDITTGVAFDSYISLQGLDTQYWSQELRLESPQEERFRWSVGSFYFDSENEQTFDSDVDVSSAVAASGLSPDELVFLTYDPSFPLLPAFDTALPQPLLKQPNIDSRQTIQPFRAVSGLSEPLTVAIEEVQQFSLFGSMEFDFTEKLTGTAELRWTDEERSLEDIVDNFFFTLIDGPIRKETSDTYWDPRFTLRYQATDDHMIYASAAHGTRSGGLNGNIDRDDDAALAEFGSFDPEENWTYEVGAKTTWFDGRLQINGSAFYVDWKDAQFRQNVSTSTGGFLTVTTNSAGLEVRGLELEVLANPYEGLILSGGYGYADAEFADGTLFSGGSDLCTLLDAGSSAFSAVPGDCVLDPVGSGVEFPDMSGRTPKRTSKHTANVAVEYTRPAFGEFDFYVRTDAAYRSKQYMDEVNLNYVPDRTVVNAAIGLLGERYDVTLWAKNLLEEDSSEHASIASVDLNSRVPGTTIVGASQRRFGITGRLRF